TVATDAATKGYADALRNFNTPIQLTGGGTNASLAFTVADLGFGARAAGDAAGSFTAANRWVWNDKPDFTGTDIMTLSEIANIQLISPSGQVVLYAISNGAASTHSFNIGYYRAASTPATLGALIAVRGYDFPNNPGGIEFYGATASGTQVLCGSFDRSGSMV